MKNIFILLLTILTLQCNARIFYVAPSGGSDSYTTTQAQNIGTPWATWQHAINNAEPGDTIYLRGGTWYPTTAASGNNILYISPDEGYGNNGEPGNPICLFNYPGEHPILDCKNRYTEGGFNTALQMYDAHWWSFRGFTIRNVYQRETGIEAFGIVSEPGSNMKFEGITINNISGNAIRMYSYLGTDYQSYDFGWDGSGYIPYDTTQFINCDVYQCVDTFNIYSPGNASDGYKIISDGRAYFSYNGCRVWHVSDDGFDIGGYQTTIIQNCWIFANGVDGYGPDGNGIKKALTWPLEFPVTIIKNNLFAYNTGFAIYELDQSAYSRTNIRGFNNTFYRNGVTIAQNNDPEDGPLLSVYRNNMMYQDDHLEYPQWETPLPYDESHNTWDYKATPNYWKLTDSVTVTNADFISVDSTGITGSRGYNWSLPEINFLKLAEGSDLIDAGTIYGYSEFEDYPFVEPLVYNGSKPDIGAFEYDGEYVPSTDTDILTFTLPTQTGAATINTTNHTVTIEVAYTADVTDLTPTITLSYGATVIPASGVSRDFTSPLPYTVTAEDGVTYQEWVVTVTQAEEPAAPAVSSRIVKYRGLILKL